MRTNKLQIDETNDDPRVVAAVKEYMSLLDGGHAPDLTEFLERHAELAASLRPALEGLALVHGAAAKPKIGPVLVMPDAEFTAKPIGDFKIVAELGRGGMGIVYEAIQLSLGRRVALKVLPFASSLDASRLQRFRNEAHAAAQLHHTNIVPVHAVGSDRGVQYYAMQLIEGKTLAELIAELRHVNSRDVSAGTTSAAVREFSRNATPPQQRTNGEDGSAKSQSTLLTNAGQRKRHYRSMVQLAHQATLALEHAHQYGVVHRDIKPGNLLLDNFGKLWVTDFGLAQIEHADLQLTRSGDALGTARYMSPEQASGNRLVLDHRTDVYSLGVTLYEMLTLEPAVRGQDYRQLLNQVAEYDPVPPCVVDPSLPIELDTIVRKAISKEPGLRYGSAQAFGEDLLAWLDDKPIAARPPTVWERLAKWRKRNSRLVSVSAGLLIAASIGLLITTLMVLREQQRTNLALQAESRQRAAAEASFQQARRAVDTFSDLSETELAYRPEFQNLRRRILETSLEFYRDFIGQRSGSIAESQELSEASARVQRMVEELKLLDDVVMLMLLADERVREELKIEAAVGEDLLTEIEALQMARGSLVDESELTTMNATPEIALRLREFVSVVGGTLSSQQMYRLKQIVLQLQLPFTFLTMEVGDALQLTGEQRQQISNIIQEERPDRRGPPGNGPPRNGPLGNGPPPDVLGRNFRPLDPMREVPPWASDAGREFHGEGPQRGGRNGPDFPGPRGPRDERGGPNGTEPQLATARTVARIIAILTAEQQAAWEVLIGAPLDPPTPWHFGNPPPR